VPELEIDLARREDVPRVVEISNWAAANTAANFAIEPEPLDDWMEQFDQTSATHPWLVARLEGEVIGFAKASPHRSRCAYGWTAEISVYIAPEHHGRGVGRALYGALIPLLRRQGFVTVLAGITSGHVASERLHARVGFVRCGTFSKVGWKFGRWHDVGYWELQLDQAERVPAPLRSVSEVWPSAHSAVAPDAGR
jgi:L-amino acid N-acyltransferase YncA